MRSTQRGSAAMSTRAVRQWDLDWLRVIAIGGIFAYHSARLFDDFEPWHVKYNELTSWLTYPMGFGSQFVMPLFWVLSGMATWLALGSRAAGPFLRRRAARLLIPLVTIGWWVSGPLQVYIESTTDQDYNAPPFEGSFLEFLPHYVSDGLYGFGGFFPWSGLHLWYLTYLFLFTAASLPLFLWLRSPAGQAAFARFAGFLCRPGAVYLLAAPLVAVEVLLPGAVPVLGWTEGGWLLGSHWVFLVLGFLMISDPRLRPAVRGQRWLSLVAASVTTVPLVLLVPQLEAMSPTGYAWFIALRTLNGWLWLMAILGFAHHLNRPARILGYLGPAVLPFYILHQPLIVAVGYLIRTWSGPIPLAWAAVALSVLAASLLIYEFGIRRFALLGLLFGTRPTRSPAPATAA